MIRALPLVLLLLAAAQEPRRPNIVLVITDDQGWGDLGCNGNPKIRTPHLDALAKESLDFKQFHVCPVCSPTRSSLLTGRYNYRTGVVDTFMGRSMMHADEVTLAEVLRDAGYRTGIFGKWHLGDNYPLRPQDQGFQDCFTIRGGGLGQPSDPPGGDHYRDATMYRNGKAEKTKGYCTDVITDAALEFFGGKKDPFFAYIAYNAPHTPLETPEGYLKPYLDAGLPEATAKVYAMVTNIDDNVGRLLKRLEELKVADDTIFIFMTDNGPQQERYNGGMRGLKTTVYEGGIRVPFFLRWKGHSPRAVDGLAAHIDVFPTLLAACKVAVPAGLKIDGRNLLPSLQDGVIPGDRTLYFQWHRGDVPEKYRACAALEDRWKLVWTTPTAAPQLFDLKQDPAEAKDVASEHADQVERLKKHYSDWYDDVESTRHFAAPRIIVGTEHEDPVVLTRQDMRQSKSPAIGVWRVTVAMATSFDVTLRFKAPGKKVTLIYFIGNEMKDLKIDSDATSVTLKGVVHPAGDTELSGTILADKPYGPDYVELQRSKP